MMKTTQSEDQAGKHSMEPGRLMTSLSALGAVLGFLSVLFCGSIVSAQPQPQPQPEASQGEPEAAQGEIAALEEELREAEAAFAASFAEGDMTAFEGFLDAGAVFMGRSTPLRGKDAIVERWTRMRGDGEAPFSWRPERVAVEADGDLGLSTGPVLSPEGEWLSSYVSTWKKTDDGWRVVLDVGPKCPPAKRPPGE